MGINARMNLIFKIVEYLPETDQIIVKFCRQNSPKPIDEYPAGAIDCYQIDFSDYDRFVISIMKIGVEIILQQEAEESTLPKNKSSKVIKTTDIKKQLNRVISMNISELIATTYKIQLD